MPIKAIPASLTRRTAGGCNALGRLMGTDDIPGIRRRIHPGLISPSRLATPGLTINLVKYRVEHDTMGEMRVPADALYGAQTQRAVENFPISGLRFPRSFLRALGLIKSAAARVNGRL